MGQTLATLDPILKEVYQGGLNDQLNNETKAWNRIKSTSRGTEQFGGKYVNFAIHVGRNSGIGSRNELEALPEAGKQSFREAMLKMRYNYASVQITGQAIELADKSYQTFASALDTEMSKVKDDISKERNRQFFGDGLGTRTIATAVASGQKIPVADARQLDLGGIYDIHTPGNSTAVTQVVITNYDTTPGAHTVTVTGTVTAVAIGDVFVRAGSYDREIHGLASILSDTTTLYGIDPTVEPLWRAEVNDNGGAPTAISELMLIRMADRIYRNGGKTTAMWTSLGVIRAYFALLSGERRFVNKEKYEGGFSGVAFQSPSGGDTPFFTDIDAPKGEIAFLNEKEITRYDAHGGYKFMDRSGSIWTQKRDNAGKYDAWDATLFEYAEMGTTRRNTHGKITNITEDSE